MTTVVVAVCCYVEDTMDNKDEKPKADPKLQKEEKAKTARFNAIALSTVDMKKIIGGVGTPPI
jgi:hypothetical protein